MKRISQLLIIVALAVAIAFPIAVQFNSSITIARQIADGGGPVPPWPTSRT